MTPYTLAGMLLPAWQTHIKYRTPTKEMAEIFVANTTESIRNAPMPLTEYIHRTALHLLEDAAILQYDRDTALIRSLSEIE